MILGVIAPEMLCWIAICDFLDAKEYKACVNEMIKTTDSRYAATDWTIIHGLFRKHGRLYSGVG